MDPKTPTPGSKDPEALELTLTQDIELPFDDHEDLETMDEPFDESLYEEDFEAL